MKSVSCLIAGMLLTVVPILFGVGGKTSAANCPVSLYDRTTDDFSFSATSDQGAVGDVVAVEVSLTAGSSRKDLSGMFVVGCYDQRDLELLGEPEYSEFFDDFSPISDFFLEEAGDQKGFFVRTLTNRDVAATYFPSNVGLPLLTVYFWIRGQPGQTSQVRFCDDAFVRGTCVQNTLIYSPRRDSPNPEEEIHAHSTRHQPGLIRILPGEPTRPDSPALPPNAKVYDEPPTAETADIRFELTGSVARPGDKDVPLRLYISSNFEYAGFITSMIGDGRYVRVTRVEEHTRPGAVKVLGAFLGIAMLNSRRRVGAEGERVHIATLFVDVDESAAEVDEVQFRFESYMGYSNWLAIYYQDQVTLGKLPITAQVEPLKIQNGVLAVRDEIETVRGDANLDLRVDISDPVSILSYLFLGGPALGCAPAADFNRSGALDIADPISILTTLFLGEEPPGGDDPSEIACR